MIYYAITIDKTSVKFGKPTVLELSGVFARLKDKCNLYSSTFPVVSYEYKSKGKVPHKIHDWLHLHATVWCKNYIDFKTLKTNGYSIKCKLLSSKSDVLNWCGYVQKQMVNQCDIIKQVKKKHGNLKELRKARKIMDFFTDLTSENSD